MNSRRSAMSLIRIITRVLIFGAVVAATVLLSSNDATHALTGIKIPLTKKSRQDMRTASSTQNKAPLKIHDDWVDNSLTGLSREVIIDRLELDLYKACVNKVNDRNIYPGYKVEITGDSGLFACFNSEGGKAKKINWDPANQKGKMNHYYTIGTKEGKLPSETNGSNGKRVSGTIKMTFDKAAIIPSDGTTRPVEITINNIYLKTKNVPDSKADTVAILTGFKKEDWINGVGWFGQYDKNKSGLLNYSAFEYIDSQGFGVKFDVTVRVLTGDSYKYRMPWSFSDIDQPQNVGDIGLYHQGNYPFAEHVILKESDAKTENKTINQYIYGWQASSNTNLGIWSDGAVYYTQGGGSQSYNSDFLILVEAKEAKLKFEWGGSGCSTEAIDAPAVLFSNQTNIKYGNTSVSNGYERRIKANTHSAVTFENSISRDDKAGRTMQPDKSCEHCKSKYNVIVNNEVVYSNQSTKELATENNKANGWTRTDTSVANGEYKDTAIKAGQTKIVWQRLDFQRTNMNAYKVPNPNNSSCPFSIDGITDRAGIQCIKLFRKDANFNGEVKTVAEGDGKTETVTSTSGTQKKSLELSYSGDGKYSVTFTQKVNRKDNEDAGGTVNTQYDVTIKETDYYRKKENSKKHTYSGTTSALTNPGSEDVKVSSNSKTYTVSGELYYDERVTLCNFQALTTQQEVNKVKEKGDGGRGACIEIHREAKPCFGDNNLSKLSVDEGRNIGKISVKNLTNGLKGGTSIVNTSGAVSPMTTNVYAKPGDSVRFTYDMCAGAFYTAEANGLKGNNNYGSRYGAVGSLNKNEKTGPTEYRGTASDGYLFKDTIPMVNNKYSNPANYQTIGGSPDGLSIWRWTNGPGAGSPMASGFMGKPWYKGGEGAFTSPDITGTNYSCSQDGAGSIKNKSYQVSGKIGCHTSIGSNIFDVGGVITQSMYWNNLYIKFNWKDSVRTTPTAVVGSFENNVATAYVKVPYNYILKPYVDNKNGEGDEEKVVYLGETYRMNPGVVTSKRENFAVVTNDTAYATISKPTEVVVETYLERDGNRIKNYNAGSYTLNDYRFNKDGNLESANDAIKGDDSKTYGVEFAVPDNDNSADNEKAKVGDKICTSITVTPADSHDHPDAVYNSSLFASNYSGDPNYRSAGGSNGETPTNSKYADIAIKDETVGLRDGSANSRTTTSCSMVAKRPTMSVESGNAYSKSGYNMSRYTKNINAGDYNFSSWSEYGVFGKINNVDEHLISGAAVGYNRSSSYYGLNSEGQKKNKTRPNSGDVSTGSNLSSKTCIFETQTFANVNCENKNAKTDEYGDPKNADIGGQSVTDYKQKILDRYRVDDKYKNVNCSSGSVQYGGESYCKVQDLGSGNGLKDYTKNNGSSAIVVKAKDDIYIGGGSPGSIPGAIPKYFTDETVGEGEDNQIDYNRTLVYDASGQSIVIDGDISYNSVGSKLDDIVGVVIIAENVYFTDVPSHIDAVIIAENEVNTCKYAEGVEMKIGEGATLNSDVCNKELIFEAPVITKKLVLNRTHGVGNGVESIQRAEIFNLNMSNYLWSFNQMSRYSQAVTTYSRELPSRY